MMRGLFITLEGGEGAGKTTQIALLRDALMATGAACITTREPGGTVEGEWVRNLLVSGDAEWSPMAETLLFYAARLQLVDRVITPTLAAGTHVICDRFYDSTFVYQGIGKAMGQAAIENIHRACMPNITPDLTIILDVPPEIGLARAAQRRNQETRFENLPITFHTAIRQGFLDIAAREPARCHVVDANADATVIHNAIMTAVEKMLWSRQ